MKTKEEIKEEFNYLLDLLFEEIKKLNTFKTNDIYNRIETLSEKIKMLRWVLED